MVLADPPYPLASAAVAEDLVALAARWLAPTALVVALVVLCLVGVATAAQPFPSADNGLTILRLAAVIGVVSVGMTFDDIERRMLFKTLHFFDNDKVRTANAFLAEEVHIIGRRRWNRRGAMVTDRYQHVVHHPDVAAFAAWAAAVMPGMSAT